ncbi:MAG TPA: TadE/TadG family type IV pilus assembly protein [Anaerolineae bacterium]|nr:TadE/TadG family type IV pilus assembly protein [Anaerolineae bacterium]HQK13637.1 TadE/TadG family type IV pilus assembly protein [Anaerolineae bacterium]
MKHAPTRAQSLVEFALILPLLLVAIFGLIDVAFIFQGYLTVAHASREGLRFAVSYQPNQGQCLHRDISGNPIPEPYPDCPIDYAENPNESDAAYYARRVLLIKRASVQAVVGLRTTTICSGADSAACILAHNNEPGMLGVRIWGFQSFDGAEQQDMPGLQGLPVRVQVVHNVPLIVFGTVLPNAHIQVRSAVGGINEGVQVGFGNLPPPTFGAVPPIAPPGTAVPTTTPVPSVTPGPTPTSTPIPVYYITLDFETAMNELPDDRIHRLAARVTDEAGRNVAGARVTFQTDLGSFSFSGVGTPAVILSTDANGIARTTLYANRPGVSTVTAWLDYDSDGVVDAIEPVDIGEKTWHATGPYLVVSDHNPPPAAWLGVSVMDHVPGDAPYSLWWCPTLITSTQVTARLAYPVMVDGATWDYEDVPVQVPLGVAGQYRIESHRGDGGSNGCNEAATLVAWSGAIEIAEVPPDLVITSVQVISQTGIAPGAPVTIQIRVANLAPVPVSQPVDVDMYMDLSSPPGTMQFGQSKQWVSNFAAFGNDIVTMSLTLYDLDPHNLWFQIDTTNYVDEGNVGGEDNNVFGPLAVHALSCVPLPGRNDDFNAGLGGQWAGMDFPVASHDVVGGQLRIMPNRGRIGGTGTNYDGGYYVYQAPVSGDFDMRLRVISIGSTDSDAEAGLMVRESMALNSRYIATLVKANLSVYQDYRTTTGGTASESSATASLPLWVRITRTGNVFRSYFSTNGSTWTERGSGRTITMGAVYVGIVANSDNTNIPGPAFFDDFSISPITGRNDNFNSGLGAQWSAAVLLGGSQSASGGTLAVTPGWGDISVPANYDSFRYLYQSPVSGNFSMTVKVQSLQSADNDANAGLMARASLSPDAAHYSLFQTKGGAVSREYRTATGGNATVNSNTASAPQYLQITRLGDVFKAYSSGDGVNWTLRRTDTLAGFPSTLYIGLATSADNGAVGPAIYDDFEACTLYDASNLPEEPEDPAVNPPGKVECTELLSMGGFEGNPEVLFTYWKAGDLNGLTGAYQRTSAQFYRGSFSIRLHASNGAIPCASNQLQPYLYQTVQFPTKIYTFSTFNVSGYYYVDKSNLNCSLGIEADPDDKLFLNLYSTGGTPLLTAQSVINGGSASNTWYPISIMLSDAMPDITAYAGQTVRLQWNGYNDTDINGTFFYLDELKAQVCTTWPIPPDQPGTASIGGQVKTRGQNNIPVLLPGADVWAYTQGGEVYHTRSIQDGTYHFYNIPPGTYVVYAEALMSGQLRTATTQVTVAADERNYNVNLLLQ